MPDYGVQGKDYRVAPDGSISGAGQDGHIIVRTPNPIVYEDMPQRSHLVFAPLANIADDPVNDRTVVNLSTTASGLGAGRAAQCINGYVVAPGEPLAGSSGPLGGQVAFPQWAMSNFNIQAPHVPSSKTCVRLGGNMLAAYGLVLTCYGTSGHLYTLTFTGASDGDLDILPQPDEILRFGGAYWWASNGYRGGA